MTALNIEMLDNEVNENIKTNIISINDKNVVMMLHTFYLDSQSKKLFFDEEVNEGEKIWGVIIKSKVTRDPIVALCVAEENILKAALDMVLKNPDAIIQMNETTIICEPVTNTDGSKAIRVVQSLTVTNSLFGHSIESIDFNELDQDQMADLLSTHNNIIKEKLAADEADE